MGSVYSFTDLPISVLSGVGAIDAVGPVIAAIVVFTSCASGNINDFGYPPLMLVLLFSAFSLLPA